VRREFSYVFAEYQYPGIPRMRLNNICDFNFKIRDLEIIPIRLFHYRLPILGFRVGNFAYITDANYIPEESMEKLIGVKYLVINALRKEKHISHFSLMEALNHIREISPRKAFITHISHQMGRYADIAGEIPPGIMLAYDGLSIDFE
jgi:phosphoribosyl 1,2-cyclic phosphate phosphodiesterase